MQWPVRGARQQHVTRQNESISRLDGSGWDDMNEWLRIMLEEIRRKHAESDEGRREHERREHHAYDEQADPGRRLPPDAENR